MLFAYNTTMFNKERILYHHTSVGGSAGVAHNNAHVEADQSEEIIEKYKNSSKDNDNSELKAVKLGMLKLLKLKRNENVIATNKALLPGHQTLHNHETHVVFELNTEIDVIEAKLKSS